MSRQTTAITLPARLTEPQQRAADLLVMGRCVDDVAQQVDVPVDELYQWRQMPLFVAAVNAKLYDARESAQQRLRALAGPALDFVKPVLAVLTTADVLCFPTCLLRLAISHQHLHAGDTTLIVIQLRFCCWCMAVADACAGRSIAP